LLEDLKAASSRQSKLAQALGLGEVARQFGDFNHLPARNAPQRNQLHSRSPIAIDNQSQ
jgi:hypothetical protein